MMHTRAVAALMLSKVFSHGQSLTGLLPNFTGRLPAQRDKAFLQELCFGSLRWYYQLNFLLSKLLDSEIKKKDLDIKALLLIGIYQLKFLRTPEHAAISATVEACRELGKPWATKLVNAVLRRYQRECRILNGLVPDIPLAKYAHPDWIINLVRNDFPGKWEEILEANNQHPPMFLRINNKKIIRDNYTDELCKKGIDSIHSEYTQTGLQLVQPVDVEDLPGFNEGWVSVQDMAAQLCFSVMNLKDNIRILDACSAPGGKLAQILEQPFRYSEVVAIEKNKDRFKKLEQTLSRLNLQANLILDDAKNTGKWWDGKLFDRILLDVPCTAMGVIRRHPDIKYLRKYEDISNIVIEQKNLLETLWPLLNKSGRLIYVTCSILDIENDQQISSFLEKHPDALPAIIHSEWGISTKHGRQIITGECDMDGFYYACLDKI